MTYEIRLKDNARYLYLHNPPQYLDAADLWQWLIDTRDDDPELYAELVHVYILLTKPLPHGL